MSHFGPGYHTGRRRPQALSGSPVPITQALYPSAQWDGTPGSGFDTIPVDPARLNAKPAIRLVVPPHQRFTSDLWVGVVSYANAAGSLIGGTERIRFHFEGETSDILAPSFRPLTHADGSVYGCHAYWVRLRKPEQVTGAAQLFVEAVPADANLQSRVIGPYLFYPEATLHDAQMTVSPSLPEIAGANYQSVAAAINFCMEQDFNNPLITVTEAMEEDIDEGLVQSGPRLQPDGYYCIDGQGLLKIAKPTYTTDDGAIFRMKVDRIRFQRCVFEMDNLESVFDGDDHWLDQCTFTKAARYTLWRKTKRPRGQLVVGNPWFTECRFENVPHCVNEASLARGCSATNIYADFAADARCVVYNRINDFDSTDGFAEGVDALEISYTGPETTATFGVNGPDSNPNPKVFAAQWGANTANFTVSRDEVDFIAANAPGYDATSAGVGYNVQDVADWVNSLPGWNAVVLDDTRAAQLLGLTSEKNEDFAPQDVKNSTLTLHTFIDLHGDFYQARTGGVTENVVAAFNSGVGMVSQNIFLSGGEPVFDHVFVANAFMNKFQDAPEDILKYDTVFSSLASNPHSHIVLAHNSMPLQELRLNSASGYEPDGYCLVANNAFMGIEWVGTPNANLVIKDNVIDAGKAAPEGSENTVQTEDFSTKFVDSNAGDFAPSGALLTNGFSPRTQIDQAGAAFPAIAAVGALAASAETPTFTAQTVFDAQDFSIESRGTGTYAVIEGSDTLAAARDGVESGNRGWLVINLEPGTYRLRGDLSQWTGEGSVSAIQLRVRIDSVTQTTLTTAGPIDTSVTLTQPGVYALQPTSGGVGFTLTAQADAPLLEKTA